MAVENQIISWRHRYWCGPEEIEVRLEVYPRTVSRVLRRLGVPYLRECRVSEVFELLKVAHTAECIIHRADNFHTSGTPGFRLPTTC